MLSTLGNYALPFRVQRYTLIKKERVSAVEGGSKQ